MNNRQKEVQQLFLNNEKAVLKKLEENYQDALKEINDRLEKLLARQDADMQHVIYQIDYQKALKAQVEAILEQLHSNSFETVSDYLAKSYEDGFIGTMYDLQGQGIPIVVPIDQKQVAIAIQHETKLSSGLYAALGKDTKRLSKQIAGEISRGISNAATYEEMARNIANFSRIPKNNAARIARTEAHRIQNKATADAQWKAKEKGADVVKQWDATLDGKTRDAHRVLDGQIRELDEPFEVEGMQAMQPGDFGIPAQDCNCRCCLLQRARWALGNDFTKWDQESGGLVQIKADDYNNFKNKYAKESQRVRSSIQKKKTVEHSEAYRSLMDRINAINGKTNNSIEYRQVKKLNSKLDPDKIISKIGGGDLTDGSCASLGLAYAGNRNGLDVLDFRGGESRGFFSQDSNLLELLKLKGVNGTCIENTNGFKATRSVLEAMKEGKEYFFAAGKHAAIVKRFDGKYQYLELQSAIKNGWKDLSNDVLKRRFGCSKSRTVSLGGKRIKLPIKSYSIDIDSLMDNDEFEEILGYLNTAEGSQKKGENGFAR